MRSLGDWLARDVITVAKVAEGDKTLEDLGIMGIEPGQHIVKCADVEPVQDAASAKLRELLADMLHDAMENVCSKSYWCDEKNWQTCNDKSCGSHLYVEMAHELGIEVD